MLHDLVSPWAAALLDVRKREAEVAGFRARHAELLEALRRQRAPHEVQLPLAMSRPAVRGLAERAAEPARQQRCRDLIAAAASLDIDVRADVFLLAGGDDGDPMEAIPLPSARLAIFLNRCDDDQALTIALARGLVAITRWGATWSTSLLRTTATSPWDRWELAQSVPLGEWLYTEALGLHLAREFLPGLPAYTLLGVTRGALHRLREREHALRTLLEEDIDQPGIGLLLRWLTPGTPASARRRGALVIPPRAGVYLAYRMLEGRVARVGIGEAARMAV